MAKSISELQWEKNKYRYQKELAELQTTNLKLSNKQLKRYWLLTTVSFFTGIISAIIVHTYTKDTGDIEKLRERINSLEQSVANLEDSAQDVKVYRTNGKDTIILK